MRNLDLRLSALQVGSMVSAIILTFVLVALYHHSTGDYYIPLPEYLSSIKLAAPPILVLMSSYVMTFLLGEKLSDAPKITIRYLKDNFFQSTRLMAFFISAVLVLSVVLVCRMSNTPPRYYVDLVKVLLGGEQDRQQLVLKEINLISLKNEGFAKQLQLVNDVFSMRSKWNYSDRPPNTTEPRILVRALSLESNDFSEWGSHPLRIHALAEAYSMWAQAAKNPNYSVESEDWRGYLKKSIELYEKVIQSNSPLATPLLKSSAINNAGNAYLYAGDYADALAYYERALKDYENLSTAGNLIATLLYQKKYEEAVRFGSQYMDWGKVSGRALTEGSSYSAVVGNTAFAHLILGNYEAGAKLMIEAYDLEADDLNALNLSLALALSGQYESAVSLMDRHFKYPALDVADQATRVAEKYNHCYYLVNVAINRGFNIPSRAANFYMYLGLAKTKSELESESPESIGPLILRVEDAVEKNAGPCKGFLMIPKFKELLHSA